MKEVIEAILDEEKAAKMRVTKAREEAKNIRAKADETVKEIKQQAQEEAQQARKALIEETRDKAQKEREARLLESDGELENFWQNNQAQIKKTIDKMFDLIIGND